MSRDDSGIRAHGIRGDGQRPRPAETLEGGAGPRHRLDPGLDQRPVEHALARPDLCRGDRERVGAHRVLGPAVRGDEVAAVLLEPHVDAVLEQHRAVRLPVQALGVRERAVEVEEDRGDQNASGAAAIRSRSARV